MLSDIYNGLKFSFSYFSIIPIKFQDGINLHKKSILAFMIFFLPFVGLILGGLSIGIFKIFAQLSYVGATIAAISYMVLYSFIHSEAIIDVVDAIFAKHSGKDPYKIIKEPTVGAIGVFYGIFAIILKLILIIYFFLNDLFIEFLLVLLISRISLQFLIFIADFESTFVIELKKSFTKNYFLLSVAFYSFIGIFFIGFKFLVFLFVGLLFGFIISKILKRKLGFLNGDALGFTLEFVEISCLVLFLYFIKI